jgi:hypothetical protein
MTKIQAIQIKDHRIQYTLWRTGGAGVAMRCVFLDFILWRRIDNKRSLVISLRLCLTEDELDDELNVVYKVEMRKAQVVVLESPVMSRASLT